MKRVVNGKSMIIRRRHRLRIIGITRRSIKKITRKDLGGIVRGITRRWAFIIATSPHQERNQSQNANLFHNVKYNTIYPPHRDSKRGGDSRSNREWQAGTRMTKWGGTGKMRRKLPFLAFFWRFLRKSTKKAPNRTTRGLFSGKSEIRTRDRIKSYTSLAGTRLRPTRPSSHLGDTNFNKISEKFQGVISKNINFPWKKLYFNTKSRFLQDTPPKLLYLVSR